MIKIVFRTDASIEMGSGHVMRCLTLAEELKHYGAAIIFICREHEGHLGELIEGKGFKVYLLKNMYNSRLDKESSNLAHSQWLGTSQEQDAHETITIFKELGKIDWVIVDHYALDYRWENLIIPYVHRLMVIDDLADRKHNCDLLLDQNYYFNMDTRYRDLIPVTCQTLIGPKYALLRSEFLMDKKKLKNRDGKLKQLFVFFGGSDPTNETGKTLKAVKMLDNLDLTVDVVVGANNPFRDEIKQQCQSLKNTRFHFQVENIAEIMNQADLAIGAGGSTTWERCYLHLPTLVITIAVNQIKTISDLQKEGMVYYLGHHDEVSNDDIYNLLINLYSNEHLSLDIYSNLKRKFTSAPTSISEILLSSASQ